MPRAAAAGIELLRAMPDVDVALVDIMMPGMDGYETIREIRAMPGLESLPIIAVTAKAMKGDRQKCIDAGASDYVSKPVDIEQLISVLRAWTRRIDHSTAHRCLRRQRRRLPAIGQPPMNDQAKADHVGRRVRRGPTCPKARILIVDDDERNAFAISTVLEELDQTLVVARSGEEALRCLLHDDFAVILLDLHMPGMDGYETAGLIRARQKTRHIPIVFLTAVFRDESHLFQAYSAGAVDMVFKPVDPFILKAKVAVFVDLYLKTAEVERQAELRHRLQEENFRVRTEKLLAEQALRRSQNRQEAILRVLPIVFHSRLIEPPFAPLFVSDNVESVTGFRAEHFVGEPDFGASRIHPDDKERVFAELAGRGAQRQLPVRVSLALQLTTSTAPSSTRACWRRPRRGSRARFSAPCST